LTGLKEEKMPGCQAREEMYLKGCFPEITPQQVLDNMDFEVDISRSSEVPAPSQKELKMLREKCDPQRLILG